MPGRRPNPRLQRARFALLRSPLSRKPLDDPRDESWEDRTLSSDATPVFKFVLPTLIVGALAAFVIAFAPAGGAGNHLLFVIAGAFAGFLLREYLLPLKRVIATAHGLSISNYRTTIAAPFTEIATAHAYKRWGIVEVIFRSETPVGHVPTRGALLLASGESHRRVSPQACRLRSGV
jgi:hypothetical protein